MKQPIPVSDSVSIVIVSGVYHVAMYDIFQGKYECVFVDASELYTNNSKPGIADIANAGIFRSSLKPTMKEVFQEFYEWYLNSDYYNRPDNSAIKFTIQNMFPFLTYPAIALNNKPLHSKD